MQKNCDINEAAEATAPAATVIVCCYKETTDLMKRIWEKCLPDECIYYIEVSNDYSIEETLTDIVCNENISENFIFLQANIIPCCATSVEELSRPVVFINHLNNKIYSYRAPMTFCKEKLIPLLADDALKGIEDICKAYSKYRNRAMEVSFNFGNYITPVLRGTPCEHVVIEGLVRKLFLCTNPEGFYAIRKILRLSFKID